MTRPIAATWAEWEAADARREAAWATHQAAMRAVARIEAELAVARDAAFEARKEWDDAARECPAPPPLSKEVAA